MTRGRRGLVVTAAAALSLFVFGFMLFANRAMRNVGDDLAKADGIVVLTGGEHRIAEGAKLLASGRAGRMLISGVNRRTGRDDLVRITGLPTAQFDCCVDLGYDALDTHGNAEETRAWVEQRGFKSVIVVTASYHMPRSLTELEFAMPGTRLFAHPVVPKGFPERAWWLHPGAVRSLVAEYVKLMPAVARLGVARLIGSFDRGAVADRAPAQRARL